MDYPGRHPGGRSGSAIRSERGAGNAGRRDRSVAGGFAGGVLIAGCVAALDAGGGGAAGDIERGGEVAALPRAWEIARVDAQYAREKKSVHEGWPKKERAKGAVLRSCGRLLGGLRGRSDGRILTMPMKQKWARTAAAGLRHFVYEEGRRIAARQPGLDRCQPRVQNNDKPRGRTKLRPCTEKQKPPARCPSIRLKASRRYID